MRCARSVGSSGDEALCGGRIPRTPSGGIGTHAFSCVGFKRGDSPIGMGGVGPRIAAVASAVVVGASGATRRAIRRRRGRCAWFVYSVVGIADDAPCPEYGEFRG